jgi:glycosyltransferase involved in cell wall biosynthesis
MTAAEKTASPRVSVIVAVRNGERYLAEALESIMAQSLTPDEIVVVNGHSTDRTVEIAQGFSLARTITQTGTGVANAYNEGIDAASGDFLAFLSHDDLWVRDKLSEQVKALTDDPELQLVTCRARFFIDDEAHRPAGLRPELLEGSHIAHIMETLFARREVFSRVGPFDESLSTAEDVDWFARANDLGVPAGIVDTVLLHKRMYGGNLSLNVEANNRNLLQALRKSLARKRSGAGEQ